MRATTASLELLVIEDEAVLGKALDRGLSETGNNCSWTRSGRQGLDLARSQKFDAIVLDLMLPDLSGADILRTLRQEGVQTPVLVLTALGSVEDRVAGLRDGADDYLVKPFAFPELTARLTALCRRSSIRPSLNLTHGPLQMEIATRRVTRDGREILLSPTEFGILELLLRFAGQVVTRKMLNEHIWGDDWSGANNVIDVHINHLRRKLERGFDQPLIHTVRGRGYAIRTPQDA